MPETAQPQSFDPARRDFSPYGLSCVSWRASLMPRPDHHNEIELNFLPAGSITYLLGGRKVRIEAGALSLFWAAIPHQIIQFTDEQPYFVATIPLQSFLQWQLPENVVQSLLQGNLVTETASDRAGADSGLFKQWEHDLSLRHQGIARAVMLEMQARITRLALNHQPENRPHTTRTHLSGLAQAGLSKVEQMACYIAQNYTQKLTVQQIGEQVNLHPSYAMNLFQKTFGTTLINFLTQHRVAHAQRMLTTTDTAITDIALQSGFTSISRFNEAFQTICLCSPREYRNAHKANDYNKQ
jgi:AraC family transcriptional regulator, melibiose operon regulatory protein